MSGSSYPSALSAEARNTRPLCNESVRATAGSSASAVSASNASSACACVSGARDSSETKRGTSERRAPETGATSSKSRSAAAALVLSSGSYGRYIGELPKKSAKGSFFEQPGMRTAASPRAKRARSSRVMLA